MVHDGNPTWTEHTSTSMRLTSWLTPMASEGHRVLAVRW